MLKCSPGTLGGGNHFIEVDVSADGTKYLVIHSGSRNLGKQAAELYQGMVIDQHKEIMDYEKERKTIVEIYKAEGSPAAWSAIGLRGMEMVVLYCGLK
jgi:RNA-splicing ligase RtcB